jgi:hypothetical protein
MGHAPLENGPELLAEGSNTPSVEYFTTGSPGPWRGSLFTGFEGALRVPFAIRWPGKIPAGKEQDNIVSETHSYGMPRVYNLIKDPGETQNVLFPETWVPKAALGLACSVNAIQNEPMTLLIATPKEDVRNDT